MDEYERTKTKTKATKKKTKKDHGFESRASLHDGRAAEVEDGHPSWDVHHHADELPDELLLAIFENVVMMMSMNASTIATLPEEDQEVETKRKRKSMRRSIWRGRKGHHDEGEAQGHGCLHALVVLQLICRRWTAVARTESLWLRAWELNRARLGPIRPFSSADEDDLHSFSSSSSSSPSSSSGSLPYSSEPKPSVCAEPGASGVGNDRWWTFVEHMRERIESYQRWAAYDEGCQKFVMATFLEGRTFVSEINPSHRDDPYHSSHYFTKSFHIQFTFHAHGMAERLCYSHLDLRTQQRSYRPITYHDRGTYEVHIQHLDDGLVDAARHSSDEESAYAGESELHPISEEVLDGEGEPDESTPDQDHMGSSPDTGGSPLRRRNTRRIVWVILTLPNVVGTLRKTEFYLADGGNRLVAANHKISYVRKKHPNKLGKRVRLFAFNVSEMRRQNRLRRLERRVQSVVFDRNDAPPAESSTSTTTSEGNHSGDGEPPRAAE